MLPLIQTDSTLDFPGGSDGKASVYNVRDLGSILGLGRFPGEGNGNPLQYSCLENPMDGGAWCRLLSTGSKRVGHDFTFTFTFRVFSNESVLHIRWPEYWSFNFSISPSNEYSELISFRVDSFDLLAVRGTLKNLLQHHNWKASILQLSAYIMVHLSHPYMTTGKIIALTIWMKVKEESKKLA